MKNNIKFVLTIIFVILAGIGLQWLFSSNGEEAEDSNRSHVRKSVKHRDMGPLKRVRKGKLARGEKRASSADEGVDRIKERPTLDSLDDSELTKLQKAVLRELQRALDDNDLVRVRKVIAKFHAPASEGGLAGDVPKVIRSHAVAALGWFGGSAVSDMVEFMADVDPEIEEDAFAKFELALDDWDISDRERASILLTVLKSVHDTERIDSMLMALNNMRNSVKGEAIIGILNTGSPEAKVMMQEQLEFFTDFDITDAGGVGKWIQDNPDNEWDEDFYGGEKKEWTQDQDK